MLRTSIKFSIIIFFSHAFAFAQYTDEINSNRPGESQGAFAVGENVFQAEAGFNFVKEKHELLATDLIGGNANLNLRYGVINEQFEAFMDIKYQYDSYTTFLGTERRSALKNIIIGGKYMLYDPNKNRDDRPNLYSWKANHRFKWKDLIPAISVFAGINLNLSIPFNLGDESKFSPKVIFVAQNQINGGFVLVTNIIVDKFISDYKSYGYIITLTKGFNETWSGFIENQGYTSKYYSDTIMRGGAAFLLNQNTQIDVSLTKNFKNTPSIIYGGIGISWRFDKNHQDVKYLKPEFWEKKSKSKNNKK